MFEIFGKKLSAWFNFILCELQPHYHLLSNGLLYKKLVRGKKNMKSLMSSGSVWNFFVNV